MVFLPCRHTSCGEPPTAAAIVQSTPQCQSLSSRGGRPSWALDRGLRTFRLCDVAGRAPGAAAFAGGDRQLTLAGDAVKGAFAAAVPLITLRRHGPPPVQIAPSRRRGPSPGDETGHRLRG